MLAIFIVIQALFLVGLIFMFRKIMTNNVVTATKHLDQLNQEYAKKEQEVNKQLEEVKQKSAQIIQEAQDESEKLKSQIVKEAEAEKDKILTQSRKQAGEVMQQAENSRQALISELDKRIAKQAIDKACELIEHTLPEEFKRQVHGFWTEELIKEGFSKLERLRLPKDIKEVKITSAFSLTQTQKDTLLKKIKSIFGKNISLKEEVESKVVAGVIISIGSLVLDGSLKNKIEEKAQSA